jgi:hypothetical protein
MSKTSQTTDALMRLSGAGALLELPKGQPERRRFAARFVQAGAPRQADNSPSLLVIEPQALQEAVRRGIFNDRAVFIDHSGFLENASLQRLAGVTAQAHWNEQDQAVYGVIDLYRTPAGNLALQIIQEAAQSDHPADVGLSMVFYPEWERSIDSDELHITKVRHIESVDLVFQPAANGRIIAALSAQSVQSLEGEMIMPEVVLSRNEVENVSAAPAAQPETPPVLSAVQVVQTLLSSGLPQAAQTRLAGVAYRDLASLQSAIDGEREYLASLEQPTVVRLNQPPPRSPRITQMVDSIDQLSLAAEALLMGVRPPNGVRPLSGIRELYHLLSGDWEMTGVYQPERVQFANVNSSTMAGLVANALNKVVVNEFQQYPQWWLPITVQQDFANLQQVKWITLGGVGELPTVAEGAAYTELTWDDNTEVANFVKKGGYLGLTLEAIDKDDTGRISAAPRALAQAAWLTLSKAISGIFTSASGVGPNLADGNALFYARSAGTNVGTSALDITAWNAVRLAMRKFTELNSGERLGALTSPKFILVPPDLETAALEILASEYKFTYALSNGTSSPVNVNAEGDNFSERMRMARARVIVVDLWTDANDWAAVADPLLYPSIGVGFRYGRTPEIFSVASPTAGLMFTNDTMPVKVRFFFAAGPMDWRGVYKMNVS